nr:hypothetical protein Itr_chr13CG12370 [Ipomoea trifida]
MGELVVCDDEHAHACMGCAPYVHACVCMVHGGVDKWRLGCRQRVCYPTIRLVVGLGLTHITPLYPAHWGIQDSYVQEDAHRHTANVEAQHACC